MPAPDGFLHLSNHLSQQQVDDLAAEGHRIIEQAPLAMPTMRDGTPLRVRVTSAGAWGWWAQNGAYKYIEQHPDTGKAWPRIADIFRDVTRDALALAGWSAADRDAYVATIDSVLINWYAPGTSLGWHIDRTEEDTKAPIVSVSIGDSARFEIKDREEKVYKYVLVNGDVCVQGGWSRVAEHRIARVYEHEGELGRPRNPPPASA